MSKQVRTVEQTGKTWKFLQLVGVVLSVWGTVKVSTAGGVEDARVIGILLIAAGIIIFLFARICAWWYHG